MKKGLTVLMLIVTAAIPSYAQQYMQGVLQIEQAEEQQVYYDRTQIALSRQKFQTVYKVFNKQEGLLYKITLTNDRPKQLLAYTIVPAQGTETAQQITYKPTTTGYYINDLQLLDTLYNGQVNYQLLVSFTDTIRDYPILHKIQTSARIQLTLDPVNSIVLRKHGQWVRNRAATDNTFRNTFIHHQRQLETLDNRMIRYLISYRDSVLSIQQGLINRITEIQQKLSDEAKQIAGDKKLAPEETIYKGEKRGGKYNGIGCMLKGSNIYSGTFSSGVFIKGIQQLSAGQGLYTGEYANFNWHGIGYWLGEDSSYQIGTFAHGKLMDGYMRLTEKDGTRYTGEIANKQRHGFGELITRQGDQYIGLFSNGRFQYGIVREAKRSETSTYKFEQATRKYITEQAAEQSIQKLHLNRIPVVLF